MACLTDTNFDRAPLAARLEQALRQSGLPDPTVVVKPVGAITRDPNTGKVKRFVPRQSETRSDANNLNEGEP